MEQKQSTQQILTCAKALDDAIERHNIEEIVSYFSDDCEIELFGITFTGKDGLRKTIDWMFKYLKEITLIPITIMVQENTFFEEFIVRTKLKNGKEKQVKQAEVLVYDEEYKVKSLRLYFDRLELTEALNPNFAERVMIKQVIKASLKGLL